MDKLPENPWSGNSAIRITEKKPCEEEQYDLQMKQCMDPNCCTPTKLNQEELKWLLMPILDSSGLHYLPYDEATL